MNIERFNKINTNFLDFELPKIKAYIPTPSDNDYKKGYITRFFCQKANDLESPIMEIDDKSYNDLVNNPFYSVVEMDWKIFGDKADVRSCNDKSVLLASKTLASVYLYLPNRLQFYKNNLDF